MPAKQEKGSLLGEYVIFLANRQGPWPAKLSNTWSVDGLPDCRSVKINLFTLTLICIVLSDWLDTVWYILQDSNKTLPLEVAIPVVIGAKIRLNIMLICSDMM